MTLSKEEHVEALTKTLSLNYDMPEEFAKGVAEFLYEEGYRKQVEGRWIKIRLSSIVCSSCGYTAWDYHVTNYCPRCGAQMSKED